MAAAEDAEDEGAAYNSLEGMPTAQARRSWKSTCGPASTFCSDLEPPAKILTAVGIGQCTQPVTRRPNNRSSAPIRSATSYTVPLKVGGRPTLTDLLSETICSRMTSASPIFGVTV